MIRRPTLRVGIVRNDRPSVPVRLCGGCPGNEAGGDGVTGRGLGGGGSTTAGALGVGFGSGCGMATGAAAGLLAGAALTWEAAAGGPGRETRLTLIAPCPNLGRGAEAGIKITDPMKMAWITRDIPKYKAMDRESVPRSIGYACA